MPVAVQLTREPPEEPKYLVKPVIYAHRPAEVENHPLLGVSCVVHPTQPHLVATLINGCQKVANGLRG